MTWNVVIFINENSVEAVPKNWFIETSSECFWPPHSYKRERIYKLIETKVEPESDWKVYSVKLLGTYDELRIAQHKARKAVISSDISSNNEDAILDKKRKRKDNPKFKDSDSEPSDNSEDDNIYPKKNVLQSLFAPSPFASSLPRKPRELKKSKTLARFRSRSFSPENFCSEKSKNRNFSIHLFDDQENTTRNSSSQVLPNNQLEVQNIMPMTKEPRDYISGSSGEKPSTNDVTSDNDYKKLVTGELTLLHLKANAISENVSSILKLMRQGETTPKESSIELYTVAEFRRLGGHSVAQAIRKICYHRSMSNEVAQNYSWDGAKKKMPFKNLSLAKSILDAVKLQYPHSMESDTITVIKIWLVKAKERLIKKNEPIAEVQ